MDNEKREHTRRPGRSAVGRSTEFVLCPFCGRETEAYTWSLYGSGKRCMCGAVHRGMGYTEWPNTGMKTDAAIALDGGEDCRTRGAAYA